MNEQQNSPSNRHQWDNSGERCVKCGAKDWMGGDCSVADSASAHQDERESPNPLCGLSWSGFNLQGDEASINEVRRLMHLEGRAHDLQVELENERTELKKLRAAQQVQADAGAVAAASEPTGVAAAIHQVRGALGLCEPEDAAAFEVIVAALNYRVDLSREQPQPSNGDREGGAV